MLCEEALISALCQKLAADDGVGGVAAILMHDPDEGRVRIAADAGDFVNEEEAFLSIRLLSHRMAGEFPASIWRGLLEIMVCSCGNKPRSRTIKVLDRVVDLFFGAPDCNVTNKWFMDFSTCEVRVRQAIPQNRSTVTFEEENNKGRYCQSLLIEVVWSCGPCSNCE